jgi:hypothetical protein
MEGNVVKAIKIYAQIYPYLTQEAKGLVSLLEDNGMDRDMAMQLVEAVMSEDEYYELG